MTMSGLIGHCFVNVTEVVLHGDSSPREASGDQFAHEGSVMTTLSV
ncbi:hypothetical protein ENSA5_65790 [Enhygromyxa salina]|uniref:Uncharacterized protein n=1 Tax=Enhygromyxa salina TaxID=215803 RepID=A0A2S9XBP2_9BACT|nr:hypothetical protein [Enhygromyxa salina]PRP90284.1 hypothetical protein ENSA5_65790 [Enhygromyxa salina]